jgi:hypothetical protein
MDVQLSVLVGGSSRPVNPRIVFILLLESSDETTTGTASVRMLVTTV